ncbi:MAG: TetR family transcriptional regulator [Myxococcales bacterium]|nr:TetR family transcriptional regulator [Myxococcales bacterium]
MTTRRAVARDESRAEVMLRAATAMARHGYHGMSMRDLAKSTRRSLASFYNLFQSKEDILFELQRTSFESLIESAEAVLTSTTDPDARLDAFVDNHVRFFVEKPDVMRVLVVEASALPPARRAAIRALKQRYFDLGAEVVAALGPEGADAMAVERAAYNVFGMLNWIFGWYTPERHGPPEVLAASIATLARKGAAAAFAPAKTSPLTKPSGGPRS